MVLHNNIYIEIHFKPIPLCPLDGVVEDRGFLMVFHATVHVHATEVVFSLLQNSNCFLCQVKVV